MSISANLNPVNPPAPDSPPPPHALTPAELRETRAAVARDVSAMLHATRIEALRRMLAEARQRANGGPTVARLEAALQEAER